MRLQLSVCCLVLLLGTALFSPLEAHAGLILDGFGNQTWDRVANPGTSPGFTLTISPDATAPPSSLWTFAVAMVIVPKASATGTLSVGPRSVPATNPLFDGNYELPFAPTSEVGGATVFTVDHASFLVNWNVTSPTNAVDLAFTSNDAQGEFEIWARPDFLGTGLTYFFSGETEYQFSNIPSGGGDVLLGTLQVIPEPSSLAALAFLGGVIGLVKYRRRKRS